MVATPSSHYRAALPSGGSLGSVVIEAKPGRRLARIDEPDVGTHQVILHDPALPSGDVGVASDRAIMRVWGGRGYKAGDLQVQKWPPGQTSQVPA